MEEIEILKTRLKDAEDTLEKIHKRMQTTRSEDGYWTLLEIEAWQRRWA